MRPRFTWTIAALLALLPAAPVVGQSPSPAPDAPVTQQVCVTVTAPASALSSAEALLEALLAGAASLDSVDEECVPDAVNADPATAGVGDTLSREDSDVTLVKVEWNVKGSSLAKPDKNKRWVAILVRYEATQDGASYNPLNWSATDPDGFSYDRVLFGAKEPDLASSNELPQGKRAQGWVTFEVPKTTKALEFVESQFLGEELRWSVQR